MFIEGDRIETITIESHWGLGYKATVGPQVGEGRFLNVIWDRYDDEGNPLMSHSYPGTRFHQSDGGYYETSFRLIQPMRIIKSVKKHKFSI